MWRYLGNLETISALLPKQRKSKHIFAPPKFKNKIRTPQISKRIFIHPPKKQISDLILAIMRRFVAYSNTNLLSYTWYLSISHPAYRNIYTKYRYSLVVRSQPSSQRQFDSGLSMFVDWYLKVTKNLWIYTLCLSVCLCLA